MSEGETVRVLGIAGSLRRGSWNAKVLHAAEGLAPAGMAIAIHDLRGIPVYDEDVRAQGVPAEVEALREAIRAADALLLVTPEYNYSIPGVLKNAIDWASRPPSQPFAGKPAAIMGASPGMLGTARAQYHLRQILGCLDVAVMPRPEAFIGGVAQKFDAEGRLADQPTAEAIGKVLTGLRDWTLVLRRGRQAG
jgi:chromate reductase